MDRLEFYKTQYAFLMGEMDKALDELEDHHPKRAQKTLQEALQSAELLWMDTFITEMEIIDEEILDKKALP